MEATAETLIPKNRQDSLVAWLELYIGIEAGVRIDAGEGHVVVVGIARDVVAQEK